MNLDALRADVALCRRTERRTFAASLVTHALLFFLLTRLGAGPTEDARLTEVSLLEPGLASEPSAPAPAALSAAAARTVAGVVHPQHEEVRFRRSPEPGDAAPDPQSDRAFADRLNERLATLQHGAPAPLAGLATVAPRAPQLASPAGLADAGGFGGGAPVALKRGGGGGSAPLALARGPGGGAADLGLAALPAEKEAAHPAAAAPRAVARAALAGVSLAGPIADRPVLDTVRPDYPDWAKREAVEGSVTLYFIVAPDGRVQDDVLVQKTAGFQEFDDNAVAALRAWRFAPLAAGRTGDQWGTITFHFRLADGR